MSSGNQVPTTPRHFGPGTGHELGIMFGFLGAMLVSMLVYGVIWQGISKRKAEKERLRIAAFHERGGLKSVGPLGGAGDGGAGVSEKKEHVPTT